MNDDELKTLLRDTFTAHEHLADPQRAMSLAHPSVRRGHPVMASLAAAAVAAVVVTGTFALQSKPNLHPDAPGPATTSSSPTPTQPVGNDVDKAAQDLVNQSEAKALARDLLDRVPALPGSTRYDKPPVDRLAEATTFIGGFADTESEAAWWTAPGTVDQAIAYFQAHTPEGLTFQDFGGSSNLDGTWSKSVEFAGTPSLTIGLRSLLVEVAEIPDGVVVRADTFVVPLPTRGSASYVDGVTSIDILTLRGERVADRLTLTDPADVARLVTLFNGLPGAADEVHGCPMIPIDQAHRKVVFHLGDGQLTAEEPIGCTHALTVRRAGQELDPPVTESQEFRAALDAIVPLGD